MSDCVWVYDETYDKWDTACGNAFVLIDGAPIENDMHYCPYCGGRLLDEEIEDERLAERD